MKCLELLEFLKYYKSLANVALSSLRSRANKYTYNMPMLVFLLVNRSVNTKDKILFMHKVQPPSLMFTKVT